jgi:hypothetical protein
MAIVRDKGWQLAKRTGALRAQLGPVEVDPEALYKAVQQGVSVARVWSYASTLEELMPWRMFNPLESPGGWACSRRRFALAERINLAGKFLGACGGRYPGIRTDIRNATRALRAARVARKTRVVHWSISNGMLLVGVISMRQWEPVPLSAIRT